MPGFLELLPSKFGIVLALCLPSLYGQSTHGAHMPCGQLVKDLDLPGTLRPSMSVPPSCEALGQGPTVEHQTLPTETSSLLAFGFKQGPRA